MTSDDYEKAIAPILAEFTREMTAREYYEGQKNEQYKNLASGQGGIPNFNIIEHRKMALEIWKLRSKIVSLEAMVVR